MVDYIEKMVAEFEKLDYILPKKAVTPTTSHLFTVNNDVCKLKEKWKKNFTLTPQNIYFCVKKERDPTFKHKWYF